MSQFSFPNLKIDLTDPQLFGNDAGEDEEPEILSSYFVDQDRFDRFLNQNTRFNVARARKGMGKSALLSKMAYDISQRDATSLVIQLTGADLSGISEFKNDDFSSMINQWKRIICERIGMEIGKNIGIAISDHKMMMVENAELEGFKGRNIVGALVARLKVKLQGKDAVEIATPQKADFAKILMRYQQDDSPATVWIFIDDIDSTFVDSTQARAKISTFFSACRALSRDIKGLNIRASVRTDVWSMIRKNEDLDKCEQYMTDITWSNDQFRRIFIKRIFSYLERKHPASQTTRFFEHLENRSQCHLLIIDRKITWTDGSSAEPHRYLKILSAGRPRWLAQLCRLSGAAAVVNHHERINTMDINASLAQYGKLRLSDLYKEHEHQFAALQKLIECFALGDSHYSTDALINRITSMYVLKVLAANIPAVDGMRYHDPLQLAHFLFKTGFIVARKTRVDFVHFDDRPDLLTTNINLDDGMGWEVHPAYRQTLQIKYGSYRKSHEPK